VTSLELLMGPAPLGVDHVICCEIGEDELDSGSARCLVVHPTDHRRMELCIAVAPGRTSDLAEHRTYPRERVGDPTVRHVAFRRDVQDGHRHWRQEDAPPPRLGVGDEGAWGIRVQPAAERVLPGEAGAGGRTYPGRPWLVDPNELRVSSVVGVCRLHAVELHVGAENSIVCVVGPRRIGGLRPRVHRGLDVTRAIRALRSEPDGELGDLLRCTRTEEIENPSSADALIEECHGGVRSSLWRTLWIVTEKSSGPRAPAVDPLLGVEDTSTVALLEIHPIRS